MTRPSPNGRPRPMQVPTVEKPRPVPGREALVLGALSMGIMLLGIQLWLLTVALELFLAGDGENIWGLALGSGVLFVGGLFAVQLIGRRPRVGS